MAIVTGASRGIGAAVARGLSEAGYRLILAARTRDALDVLAHALPTDTVVCVRDLREPDAAQRLVDEAISRFGRVDAVVNNAGATPRGDLLDFSDDDWTDGFALKFFGAVRLCRSAWPHLVPANGAIVNIAGIGGRTGNAEFTIGGTVNSALLNLTKALADRGVRDGVRVNAVNPSAIATERTNLRVEKVARERNISVDMAASELAAELRVARFETAQ